MAASLAPWMRKQAIQYDSYYGENIQQPITLPRPVYLQLIHATGPIGMGNWWCTMSDGEHCFDVYIEADHVRKLNESQPLGKAFGTDLAFHVFKVKCFEWIFKAPQVASSLPELSPRVCIRLGDIAYHGSGSKPPHPPKDLREVSNVRDWMDRVAKKLAAEKDIRNHGEVGHFSKMKGLSLASSAPAPRPLPLVQSKQKGKQPLSQESEDDATPKNVPAPVFAWPVGLDERNPKEVRNKHAEFTTNSIPPQQSSDSSDSEPDALLSEPNEPSPSPFPTHRLPSSPSPSPVSLSFPHSVPTARAGSDDSFASPDAAQPVSLSLRPRDLPPAWSSQSKIEPSIPELSQVPEQPTAHQRPKPWAPPTERKLYSFDSSSSPPSLSLDSRLEHPSPSSSSPKNAVSSVASRESRTSAGSSSSFIKPSHFEPSHFEPSHFEISSPEGDDSLSAPENAHTNEDPNDFGEEDDGSEGQQEAEVEEDASVASSPLKNQSLDSPKPSSVDQPSNQARTNVTESGQRPPRLTLDGFVVKEDDEEMPQASKQRDEIYKEAVVEESASTPKKPRVVPDDPLRALLNLQGSQVMDLNLEDLRAPVVEPEVEMMAYLNFPPEDDGQQAQSDDDGVSNDGDDAAAVEAFLREPSDPALPPAQAASTPSTSISMASPPKRKSEAKPDAPGPSSKRQRLEPALFIGTEDTVEAEAVQVQEVQVQAVEVQAAEEKSSEVQVEEEVPLVRETTGRRPALESLTRSIARFATDCLQDILRLAAEEEAKRYRRR